MALLVTCQEVGETIIIRGSSREGISEVVGDVDTIIIGGPSEDVGSF